MARILRCIRPSRSAGAKQPSWIVYGIPENALVGTKMARAQCTTIRPRLLKIGARIRITARKVWISLASGYAWAEIFEQVYANLERGEQQSG